MTEAEIKKELEKGLVDCLIYGSEGFALDDKGNLRCVSDAELGKIMKSGKPFMQVFTQDWYFNDCSDEID